MFSVAIKLFQDFKEAILKVPDFTNSKEWIISQENITPIYSTPLTILGGGETGMIILTIHWTCVSQKKFGLFIYILEPNYNWGNDIVKNKNKEIKNIMLNYLRGNKKTEVIDSIASVFADVKS